MRHGIRKLLVANRGEIAVRVLRTARSLGYRTVAVHSDADRDAPFVRLADEAVAIGPAPARDSYLRLDALLEACRRTGADALHPGYGFLSENAELPRRCLEAGIRFVGPPAEAMLLMGDKARAKRLMMEAGVPVVPGYQGDAQDDATLAREAARIGYPVLVKAAAGGGGRGMRIVRAPGDLAAEVASARREAEGAFGNGALLLERLVEDARHVEVQVFADTHGNVIHLGERECSVQRRHQKIIEESPSPAVDPALRERLGQAAVAAARAVGYVNAGTIEFLLAPSGEFWFMEMNTRLQVEHPVTELVTGLDLVAWQLAVAAGEPLPLAQGDVRRRGHAIEARLYAEDPYAGFLPQSGVLARWRPPAGEGIRVDSGVREGQEVSPYYDPLLAKLVAFGDTRELARRRLLRAVGDTVTLGLLTNRELLADILDSDRFVAGDVRTRTIDERFAREPPLRPAPSRAHLAVAAILVSQHVRSPAAAAWRSAGEATWPVRLVTGSSRHQLRVRVGAPGAYLVEGAGDESVRVEVRERGEGSLRCAIDGVERTVWLARQGRAIDVQLDGVVASFEEPEVSTSAGASASDGRVVAPMTGVVLSVAARAGDAVAAGQLLLTLTAMKMEHRVLAPVAGTVGRVAVSPGEQVSARALLVEIAPANGDGRAG